MINDQLVYGTRAVIEAIKAGKEIERLLIQQGIDNPLVKDLLSLAKERQIAYSKVPTQKLHKITNKNHQGVICILSSITYSSLDHVIGETYQGGKIPGLVILDRITDVRNFGAIARSALGAGMDAIVIPSRGAAQITGDAIKTSVGALHHIPVCRERNLKKTLRFLKDSGIRIVACSEKADLPVYQIDLTGPSALLLGSEENGISTEYLKLADDIGSIPIVGNVGSLNVSVAAGIAMFEMRRQRS